MWVRLWISYSRLEGRKLGLNPFPAAILNRVIEYMSKDLEVEISLPEEGEFKNKAGQTIKFKLDPIDKTKCTVWVDDKPLDFAKYMEEEAKRLREIEDISKGAGIRAPVVSKDK